MDIVSSEQFRHAFALLEKYKFSCDISMFHDQLPAVTNLVRDFPNTVVIIDNVARPIGERYSNQHINRQIQYIYIYIYIYTLPASVLA